MRRHIAVVLPLSELYFIEVKNIIQYFLNKKEKISICKKVFNFSSIFKNLQEIAMFFVPQMLSRNYSLLMLQAFDNDGAELTYNSFVNQLLT